MGQTEEAQSGGCDPDGTFAEDLADPGREVGSGNSKTTLPRSAGGWGVRKPIDTHKHLTAQRCTGATGKNWKASVHKRRNDPIVYIANYTCSTTLLAEHNDNYPITQALIRDLPQVGCRHIADNIPSAMCLRERSIPLRVLGTELPTEGTPSIDAHLRERERGVAESSPQLRR